MVVFVMVCGWFTDDPCRQAYAGIFRSSVCLERGAYYAVPWFSCNRPVTGCTHDNKSQGGLRKFALENRNGGDSRESPPFGLSGSRVTYCAASVSAGATGATGAAYGA